MINDVIYKSKNVKIYNFLIYDKTMIYKLKIYNFLIYDE